MRCFPECQHNRPETSSGVNCRLCELTMNVGQTIQEPMFGIVPKCSECAWIRSFSTS